MKQTRKQRQKKKAAAPTQGLHKAASPKQMVLNSQVRDSSSKIIFDNHILCSQFLRDYVNLPYLKDVRPEDIEDVYIDQLHGNYTTKERINGDWRITFPLQRLPVQTIPLDSIWEDTPALALHLSALGCTLELEGEAQHLEPVKQPFTVYLKDGSTVTTADSDGGVCYGAYTSLHWSFPQPADLEQVEGVSIDGWYIPLKNGQAQPGYWLTS